MGRMVRAALVLIATGLCLASVAAQGADAVEHSGRIVAVDMKIRTMTLEEMGPWTGLDSRPIKRLIRLEPTTTITLAARANVAAPGGWLGGFRESPLSASDLRPGDYVTIRTVSERTHLSTVSVVVVRPTGGGEPTASSVVGAQQ